MITAVAAVWLASVIGCQDPGRAPQQENHQPQGRVKSQTFPGHQTEAVPSACTPAVNGRLAELISSPPPQPVDNVMVCGVTVSSSRTQAGGRHGSHQILPLRVTLPGSGVRLVEVVTNDDLDGRVTAGPGAAVFALGQAFFPSGGRFVAGVHDVHCSTHRGAEDGWVVVDGEKHPASCSR